VSELLPATAANGNKRATRNVFIRIALLKNKFNETQSQQENASLKETD